MIIKSLAFIAALGSAHGASHLASDLMRFSTRLASRALPAYVAPPLAMYSEALTHRWMSTGPIKAPEFFEPTKGTNTIPTLPDAAKPILKLPEGMIDPKAPLGENTRRIRSYVKEHGLHEALQNKVLTNCLTDLASIAHHHGDDPVLSACAEEIRTLPSILASGKHSRVISDELDVLSGVLSNRLLHLKRIKQDSGKVIGTEREVSAITHIFGLIDEVHENVVSKPRYK